MTSPRPNIHEFWCWFSAHKPELDVMVDTESALWAQALAQIKSIDPGLWFELSHPDGTPREFILTVEGKKDMFPLVESMIAQAPKLPDWRFYALKPAMGFDFTTRYEEVLLEPKKMWFLPLANESRPAELALRVGIPNLTPDVHRQASNGVLVVLDTALGERSAASDIVHIEICALPQNPEADGFVELPELASYIGWHKRKYGTA